MLNHFNVCNLNYFLQSLEWSGGAIALGKLPVSGRPTNLGTSRARAYSACSRCVWGLFGNFFSRLSLTLGDGPT